MRLGGGGSHKILVTQMKMHPTPNLIINGSSLTFFNGMLETYFHVCVCICARLPWSVYEKIMMKN